MSSISSFVCPSCDVEGSSRYLLEYFELFHAMKKSFYSQYLDEESDVRLERMSECVEARTGDEFLHHLIQVHGADGQHGKLKVCSESSSLIGNCVGSELRISHMTKVLQFISRQLPPGGSKQKTAAQNQPIIGTSDFAIDKSNKEKQNGEETANRSCVHQDTSQMASPTKKAKIDSGISQAEKSVEGKNDTSGSTRTAERKTKSGDVDESTSNKDTVQKEDPSIEEEGGYASTQYPGTITRRNNRKKAWRAETSYANGYVYLGGYETRGGAVRAIESYYKSQQKERAIETEPNNQGDEVSIQKAKPVNSSSVNTDANDEIIENETAKRSCTEQDTSRMASPMKKVKSEIGSNLADDSLEDVDDGKSASSEALSSESKDGVDDTNISSDFKPMGKSATAAIGDPYPRCLSRRCAGKKTWRAWTPKKNGTQTSLGSYETRAEALRAVAAYQQYQRTSTSDGDRSTSEGEGDQVCIDGVKPAVVNADAGRKKQDLSSEALIPYPGTIEQRHDRKKCWAAMGPKVNGIKKWLGSYETHEDAVNALEKYHQSQQTNNQDQNQSKAKTDIVQSHQRKQSRTGCLQPPRYTTSSQNSNALQQIRDKLDPLYLVGMPLQIFNPVDNSYHSGRIIDCKNIVFTVDDSTADSKMITGSFVDENISSTLYLVRFPGGIDGRKVDIQQWIFLEEHAVTVGSEVCWARVSSGPDPPISYDPSSGSPYRPVQVVFRSMLENISSAQYADVFEHQSHDGVVGYKAPLNILAMGFGEAFSSITLTLQESHTDCELPQNEEIATAANTTSTDTRPTVFPFKPRDPMWLNDLLRRVRISDEDVGVAVVGASAEKEEEKRIRSTFGMGHIQYSV